MGLISFPSNLYVVYPIYYNFMPKEVIIEAYNAISPVNLTTIGQCLIFFNVPFTILKGMLSAIITVLIYQPLRPILKGNNN